MPKDVFLADDAGLHHAERREDFLVQVVPVEFSGNFADQNSQQNIVGVAVGPGLAGLELDGKLGNFAIELVFGDVKVQVERRAWLRAFFGFVFGEAGSVGEQVSDGDGLPGVRGIGKIFPDGIVEADFSGFDEHHDGSSSELLADGTRLE